MQQSEPPDMNLTERNIMAKLTPIGRSILCVAVGVVVGLAGTLFLSQDNRARTQNKRIQWEYLEATDGDDLYRTETSKGWIITNEDGFLGYVPDESKEWLKDQ